MYLIKHDCLLHAIQGERLSSGMQQCEAHSKVQLPGVHQSQRLTSLEGETSREIDNQVTPWLDTSLLQKARKPFVNQADPLLRAPGRTTSLLRCCAFLLRSSPVVSSALPSPCPLLTAMKASFLHPKLILPPYFALVSLFVPPISLCISQILSQLPATFCIRVLNERPA